MMGNFKRTELAALIARIRQKFDCINVLYEFVNENERIDAVPPHISRAYDLIRERICEIVDLVAEIDANF